MFFGSCGSRSENELSSKGFDLSSINFKEDPIKLLGPALDSSINAQEEYAKKGFSQAFDYPVGYKLESWNDSLSFYGKAYYSKTQDSIAHFEDIYFDRIAFLTHEGKTVAVRAEADFLVDSVYQYLGKKLQKLYGEPTFSPQTDQDVFSEWRGEGKYFQTDFYTGGTYTVMSDKAPVHTEVYTVQFLIFNKEAADAIHEIQSQNYHKNKSYKVMEGDFKIYSQDPNRNLTMGNELMSEKFN